MRIKVLVTSVLMLCGMSSTFAQSDNFAVDMVFVDTAFVDEMPSTKVKNTFGYGGKHNSFKVDFDFGWYISKFVDCNNDSHRGIFATGGAVSYEHVFKSGYGFGLNLIYDTGSDNIMTLFLGPSFVSYTSVDQWTYGYSLGLGFGRFSFDSERMGYEDRAGLGYFVQVEAERRFNKWFGLGAALRVFNVTTSKPEGYMYSSGSYGTGLLNFSIGPRFYF